MIRKKNEYFLDLPDKACLLTELVEMLFPFEVEFETLEFNSEYAVIPPDNQRK